MTPATLVFVYKRTDPSSLGVSASQPMADDGFSHDANENIHQGILEIKT